MIMKFRMKVLCSLLTAAMCCTPVLSGCSSQEEPSLAQEEAEGKEQDVLDETDGAAGEGAGNLGKFSMEDINGSAYTEELFADHDLTMVNVFTTWCTPCIREIPDLEKLHKEMEGQGVGVVGIVLDAIGSSGKVDEKAVEKAKILAEKTGAAYPFLIPDEGYLGGRNWKGWQDEPLLTVSMGRNLYRCLRFRVDGDWDLPGRDGGGVGKSSKYMYGVYRNWIRERITSGNAIECRHYGGFLPIVT